MEYRVHIYTSQRDQKQFTYGDIASIREDGTGRTANLTECASDRLGEVLAAAMAGDQLSNIVADSFGLNAHLYRLILPTDRDVIARLEAASPFELMRDAIPATRGIPGQTAERLREILNAASDGDNLDRFFSHSAISAAASFANGWERGITDFLSELRASEQTDAIGRAVWEAWHSGMVTQGREVAPYRQDWDTLPPDDQQLDRAIGTIVIQRLAVVCAENARAQRSMRDHAQGVAIYVGQMTQPLGFMARAQPDTSDDRPHIAKVRDAVQSLFSSEGKSEGKPATAEDFTKATEGIATLDGWIPARDVLNDTLTEAQATIVALRVKNQRQRERSGHRFRRMEKEREILEAQIAYHKERSVNVTARLEATQTALIEIGTLKINEGMRESAEREVNDLGWHAKYEDAAATLEKVIADRDALSRTLDAVSDLAQRMEDERDTAIEGREQHCQGRLKLAQKTDTLTAERNTQAREIAGHKETIAKLSADAALRATEIDTLRDELTRARSGDTGRSEVSMREFDHFMRRVDALNIRDALTYNLAEMRGEVDTVERGVRGLTGENAAQWTNRLITIAARAFAVHEIRGQKIGGNPPPAFVTSTMADE